MFYHIGDHNPYLKKVHDNLFLDEGWTCLNNVWYKGYSTDCALSENISKIIAGYQPRGIWCMITYDDRYHVYYPRLRGFPEHKTETCLTNLYIEGSTFIPNSFNIELKEETNLETVAENIKNILLGNCKGFVEHNSGLMNIWCTGGIDSTSIIALCEEANIPYNVYIAKPTANYNGSSRAWEKSVNQYSTKLTEYTEKHHWGYEILSHFSEPMVLSTGFYGDEYLSRGPGQINYIANSLGGIATDFLKGNHYMYDYIIRSQKKKPYAYQQLTEAEAKQKIVDDIFSDYQIWHLDNTMTFCPYYDIDILIEALRIKSQSLIEYLLDGTIQKEIIKKCCPDVLRLTDTYKNTFSGRINFERYISSVNLRYCKNIYWV